MACWYKELAERDVTKIDIERERENGVVFFVCRVRKGLSDSLRDKPYPGHGRCKEMAFSFSGFLDVGVLACKAFYFCREKRIDLYAVWCGGRVS